MAGRDNDSLSASASISEDDATVISSVPPIPPRPNIDYLHPRELGQALEGQLLDHYELTEFIGGGGMGAVFRAQDTLLDRTVAVKVLASGQADDEETRLRFRNEAQSAARLDHTNIARVHYVGEANGIHYIVFEYIKGINVRDLVAHRGPLRVEEAFSYTLQIAEALAHAWQREVVHRDIKPSNILVTAEHQARLVDMGLARMKIGDHGDELTASGVTLGTFDYISPEQARDPRDADTRSDIYSLGCTLYYMLCGVPPFPDGTVLQKLLQHQEEVPPDPAEYRADLTPELRNLIRKMLAKSPDDRFQSPVELIAAIIAAAEQSGLSLSRPATAVPLLLDARRSVAFRRYLPWLVPVALLIAGVLLIDSIGRQQGTLSNRVDPPNPVRATLGEPRPLTDDPQVSPGVPAERTRPVDSARSNGVVSEENPSASLADSPPAADRPMQAVTAPEAVDDDVARRAAGSWGGGLPVLIVPGAGVNVPTEVYVHRVMIQGLGEAATSSASPAVVPNGPDAMNGDLPLVVDPTGNGGVFQNLEAACLAAESGEIVELRYNGPPEGQDAQPFPQRPVLLRNKHLTIRAGEGFQPVLRFRPARVEDTGTRSVFTVIGGTLRLVNLDIVVQADESAEIPPDTWTFVSAKAAEGIQISGCRVTLRPATLSAAPAPATYIEVADADAVTADEADRRLTANRTLNRAASNGGPTVTRIRIDNCIFRGGRSLIRPSARAAFELAWTNGFFATDGRVVDRRADESVSTTSDRTPDRIELAHVTMVLGSEIVRMAADVDSTDLRPLSIALQDCLIVGEPSTVLFDQSAGGLDSAQEAIIWRAERTYYDGIESFLRLAGDASTTGVPLVMEFDGWQEYWSKHPLGDEIYTARAAIHWKNPSDARGPACTLRIADYLLDDSDAEHPELHAASDGGPVGMRFDLLPWQFRRFR